MVNAIRGLLIHCDIPMTEFIISLNAARPPSEKFIIQVLDNTHMFVQPNVAEQILHQIDEFRNKITYEKPA